MATTAKFGIPVRVEYCPLNNAGKPTKSEYLPVVATEPNLI
jgi:hypothetical protein